MQRLKFFLLSKLLFIGLVDSSFAAKKTPPAPHPCVAVAESILTSLNENLHDVKASSKAMSVEKWVEFFKVKWPKLEKKISKDPKKESSYFKDYVSAVNLWNKKNPSSQTQVLPAEDYNKNLLAFFKDDETSTLKERCSSVITTWSVWPATYGNDEKIAYNSIGSIRYNTSFANVLPALGANPKDRPRIMRNVHPGYPVTSFKFDNMEEFYELVLTGVILPYDCGSVSSASEEDFTTFDE